MKFLFGFLTLSVALVLTIGAKGQGRLMGIVTDKDSRPVAGVSVHVLNTEITVMTDTAGNFVLPRLAAVRYSVELSAVGFTTLVKTVVPGSEPVRFQMTSSLMQLDAV